MLDTSTWKTSTVDRKLQSQRSSQVSNMKQINKLRYDIPWNTRLDWFMIQNTYNLLSSNPNIAGCRIPYKTRKKNDFAYGHHFRPCRLPRNSSRAAWFALENGPPWMSEDGVFPIESIGIFQCYPLVN